MKQVTDHAFQAGEDLAGPFLDDESVVAIAQIFGARIQEIEDCVWSLFAQLDLDSVTNPHVIRLLSRLLDLAIPDSLTTVDKVVLLKARAAANSSQGTTPWLYQVVESLSGAVLVQLPGGVEVQYESASAAPTELEEYLVAELSRAQAAPLNGAYLAPVVDDSLVFAYETEAEGNLAAEHGEVGGVAVYSGSA